MAAATVGLATTIVGLTTAAQATPYGSNLPVTAWTYTDSGQPDAPALNPTGDMPVGTFTDGSGIKHTRRAYYTYDISSLAGRVPHQVNLYSYETSVQNCKVQAPLEVYRTKAITAATDWHKAPAELELLDQETLGKGTICPGYYFGVDVTAQIEAALSRHEKTLTFEVRIAASAEKDAKVARTFRPLTLFVQSNAVPKVSAPQVKYASSTACGTPAKHPTAVQPQLSIKVNDADTSDTFQRVTFAVWPVDHPDQRTTLMSNTTFDGTAVANASLTGYADGTVVAWQAQAADDEDTSAWSKPCFLTVDKTAPTAKPVVTSTKYGPSVDGVGTGGQGVPGTFLLDAAGDHDTVGFDVSDDFYAKFPGYVATNHPGGKARLTLTPQYGGGDVLHVTPVDGAGNRGPVTDYAFDVRRSGPYADVTVNGVDVPSHVVFSAGATVTSYTYLLEDSDGNALPGETEVKVAATGDTAETDIVFPEAGYLRLRIRAYNGKKLVGDQTQEIDVSDAPSVTSDTFTWDGPVQLVGTHGTFTFSPRRPGTVAYLYDFGDGNQQRIDAQPDGTAVLDWTPTEAGYYFLTVESVDENGYVSRPDQEIGFQVIDPRPSITTDISTGDNRTDGAGVPFTVYLSTDQYDATGFVYSVDGGPQQTTDSGWSANFQVTPAHSGDLKITAQARFADGTLSPARTITVTITDAPTISVAGKFGQEIVGGLGATITFKPGRDGVTAYRYTVDGSDETTVTAGADGSATTAYTPEAGYHYIDVVSLGADGATSDNRQYAFYADPQDVQVYAKWQVSSYSGVGVQQWASFSSWLGEYVTGYVWHFNDEDAQTTPVTDQGAQITWTPKKSGANVLYVQQQFTDGTLSPVTEVPFTIGTNPEISCGPGSPYLQVGTPAAAVMHGGVADVTSFDYSVTDEAGTTLASGSAVADADGSAQVAFTPAKSGSYLIQATAHNADTTGDQTQFTCYAY